MPAVDFSPIDAARQIFERIDGLDEG